MPETTWAVAAKPWIWLAQFPKGSPDVYPVRFWNFIFHVAAGFRERWSQYWQNRIETFPPIMPPTLRWQPHHQEWRHCHCRKERANHASQVI